MESNKELWGDDLFSVFGEHIDENGWLTADWAPILEAKVPKWDSDYNDNPEHANTYSRMYNLDFQYNEDKIRPIVLSE